MEMLWLLESQELAKDQTLIYAVKTRFRPRSEQCKVVPQIFEC